MNCVACIADVPELWTEKQESCVIYPSIAAMKAVIVEHHYTHSVPSGKSRYYQHEAAIVVFSIPPNKNISSYLLGKDNVVWELSRLWAPDGHAPNLLTQAIAAAVTVFHADEPAVQALVSYADPSAGHEGFIYRAASWLPLGQCEETRAYRSADGQIISRRKFHSGDRSLRKAEIEALGYVQIKAPGKLRFVRGLTRKARRRLTAKQDTILNERN
jgi:hypothetical protein